MSSPPVNSSAPNDNNLLLDPIFNSFYPPQPISLGEVAQTPPSHPFTSTPPSFSSFSTTLRFGVEDRRSVVHASSQLRSALYHQLFFANLIPSAPSETPVGSIAASLDVNEPIPTGDLVSDSTDELVSLCLLAKLWGESVPIPIIISKTNLDRNMSKVLSNILN